MRTGQRIQSKVSKKGHLITKPFTIELILTEFCVCVLILQPARPFLQKFREKFWPGWLENEDTQKIPEESAFY